AATAAEGRDMWRVRPPQIPAPTNGGHAVPARWNSLRRLCLRWGGPGARRPDRNRIVAMKVLVADKFEKSGLEGLTSAGCEVLYEPDAKDDALAQAIVRTGAEVLAVPSTKARRA